MLIRPCALRTTSRDGHSTALCCTGRSSSRCTSRGDHLPDRPQPPCLWHPCLVLWRPVTSRSLQRLEPHRTALGGIGRVHGVRNRAAATALGASGLDLLSLFTRHWIRYIYIYTYTVYVVCNMYIRINIYILYIYYSMSFVRSSFIVPPKSVELIHLEGITFY